MSLRFDDRNLVSCAGLAAVLALAARCGLPSLVAERVQIAAKGGANAAAKVLDEQVRAPSTLGTFLRSFRFGHVRQLDAVAAGLLARLAAACRS